MLLTNRENEHERKKSKERFILSYKPQETYIYSKLQVLA